MRTHFFRKTAWSNIRKNYRFFIPRILAETGLLGCFYIAVTLTMDDRLSEVKGGAYLPTFMVIGTVVLAILSTVLMFYVNSFLMKQRKREFGLYNVLGMEKRHVGRVLFHECFICSSISVILGLGFGMLFYKLCSLLICRLLSSEVIIGFYFIKWKSLLPAGAFFVLLDLATYLFNLMSIARMKPVELLESRQAGEREPKVKWLMLLAGVVTLAGGYYISITTLQPLEALMMFFVAVVLVIIGTYFLFVTGSVFVLKTLKNNPRYYYQKRHMPSVSGLLYRMKQNAVGLASIAILATGVLVMISTTTSLYVGMDGTLNKNFPCELYMYIRNWDAESLRAVSTDKLKDIVRAAADEQGVGIKEIKEDSYISADYYYKDDTFYVESEVEVDLSETLNGLVECVFISADVYRDQTGTELGLKPHEIAICRISSSLDNMRIPQGTISIHGVDYSIASTLSSFPIKVQNSVGGFPIYGIVLASEADMDELDRNECLAFGSDGSFRQFRLEISFDDRDEASAVGYEIYKSIRSGLSEAYKDLGIYCIFDSYWETRESMIGMYGTLLFLGILLGSVCMFATVLIIYYKQISEGYEDRERFQIMEKIGMSHAEVRKTIDHQVLLVFFLPLIVAGIHFVFAYPILQRMLKVLMLYDPMLFVTCSLISYGVFALIYVLIYRGTSRTYYKIVN